MSRGEFNFHKDSYLVDPYFIPGVFSETTPHHTRRSNQGMFRGCGRSREKME